MKYWQMEQLSRDKLMNMIKDQDIENKMLRSKIKQLELLHQRAHYELIELKRAIEDVRMSLK